MSLLSGLGASRMAASTLGPHEAQFRCTQPGFFSPLGRSSYVLRCCPNYELQGSSCEVRRWLKIRTSRKLKGEFCSRFRARASGQACQVCDAKVEARKYSP